MELMRGLAFIALLFAGSAVGAELRQAEVCTDGTTHQAGYCPAVLSSASCSATGATTGSCSATSDESDGTRYVCATSNTTALTGAEIEACSGGAAIAGSSASETGSNSVSLSGLTTDAAHYGQIVNESPEGWYSNRLVSSSFTPNANGDLYDLSGLVNNVFEVTWPTAPTTSSTVNVSNSSELESAISGSAVRIVMADGTYSGSSLTFGGNDIDIVAGDNVDVLYTQVNLLSRQRIRITGGNWGAPGSPMRWSMRGSSGNGLTDVLWDDFNFYGRIETLGGAPGGETTAARRLAIINSTFDGDAANEYGLDGTFFFVFNNPAQFEDVTFANVKMDNASGGNYVNRMHGIQRLLVLDSAFNMKPSYPGTVAGLRMGEETNGYHIQDTLIGNRIFGSLQSPGDLQQFGNGWFENVSRYTRGSDTVWSTWQNENPPNTGTVNNSTTYHDGATVGVPFSLGTTLSTGPDGNNLIQSYSVLPDVSAYGAQR